MLIIGKDSHKFTIDKESILYSRVIIGRLYTIRILLKGDETLNKAVDIMNNMKLIDDETLIDFSRIQRDSLELL